VTSNFAYLRVVHALLSSTNHIFNKNIVMELCLQCLISDPHDVVASMNLLFVSLYLNFVYCVITCLVYGRF
jgi:hypothetical protein